jgi:hypothetical protein
MKYSIVKRRIEDSKPKVGGGFTEARVMWDVVTEEGNVIRTFRHRSTAVKEIKNRSKRKTELAKAADEARATGQPVVVRRRGRSPITVSFRPV